ncbi:MAG: ABC transporter ATP-binding protein [Candidatus Njordarchaeia archaeon]
MKDYVIETKDLTKIYRDRKGKEIIAVNRVNIKVKRGEFFGLLGPNGAGKTTLTKMIATLLLPDEGEAWVEGYSILKDPLEVRKRIGWMMGETGGRALYWRLSGIDNLRFFARLLNVPKDVAEKRIWAFLRFMDLEDAARKLVMEYSTGMKIKLMLIRALLHNPDILILDEPTLGLDVESARKIRTFLRTLVDEMGKTIMFTSHNMYEVEMLCDEIAVINKGKIVFQGSPRKIREIVEEVKVVEIQMAEPPKNIKEMLDKIEKLHSVKQIMANGKSNEFYYVRVSVDDPYEAIPELVNALKGYKIDSIQRALPTLEDAFLKIASETGLKIVEKEKAKIR